MRVRVWPVESPSPCFMTSAGSSRIVVLWPSKANVVVCVYISECNCTRPHRTDTHTCRLAFRAQPKATLDFWLESNKLELATNKRSFIARPIIAASLLPWALLYFGSCFHQINRMPVNLPRKCEHTGLINYLQSRLCHFAATTHARTYTHTDSCGPLLFGPAMAIRTSKTAQSCQSKKFYRKPRRTRDRVHTHIEFPPGPWTAIMVDVNACVFSLRDDAQNTQKKMSVCCLAKVYQSGWTTNRSGDNDNMYK